MKEESNGKKWAKDMNRYFFKEVTQLVNKYMKRGWVALVVREMHIKTIRSLHTHSVVLPKRETDKCWQNCGDTGMHALLAGCEVVQSLCTAMGGSSQSWK